MAAGGGSVAAAARALRSRSALLPTLAAALLLVCALRGRGATAGGGEPRARGAEPLPPGVNKSSPSCRAAALGPTPSKESLAALGRPLPRYMTKAADGDEKVALSRWAETLHWRCGIGDEALLARPHPNLARIAPHYPTFLHLPDREGRLTYWELIGAIDQQALKRKGLRPNDIVEHYIWSTLFTWDIAAKDDAHEVTIIVDMAGLRLSTLTPTVLKIFMRVARLLRRHFPQREHGIFFINAPAWWEQAYGLVAPLVSQRQREKVRMLGPEASPALLTSLIDPASLPVAYGGHGPPLGSSPLEAEKRMLAAHGVL